MKPRFAVGIAINGNEVRAAFLSLVRGKACIHALESTRLEAPLESSRNETKPESLNELEKAFDIQEPEPDEASQDQPSEKSTSNHNVSAIYALLDRFQTVKVDVAVNAPILSVKYDFLQKDTLPKDKTLRKRLREKIDLWGYDADDTRRTQYLNISDGKVLEINYECHPPIIDIVEEVSQFRAGRMNLLLMDTNELALADLICEIYKLKKDEITAIVHIEEDFSRVIFMKGRQIYHITPIIHKGSLSKDVLEVIYSRMIFAQDHYFIPELNKILVAGHSSKLKAKYYFRQKFPSAITGYVNSRKMQSRLRFKDRGLLFSRYAVPIALAWKALQKRTRAARALNLLPEYITESKRLPSLAVHGYLLLFMLAGTAFGFSWVLVKKNLAIHQINRRIAGMNLQIGNNKALTERVKSFDDRIVELENKIALVDTFSVGYRQTQEFLHLLNESVRRTGELWITSISKHDNTLDIQGLALRREKIPILANALGGANLKKVTRGQFRDQRVFTFHLERQLDALEPNRRPNIFTLLNRGASGNSSGGNEAPR